MASQTSVPASLKSADIARFALRAQQLQQAKPTISYWCHYWIVQVILTKGLHNADDEALKYTTKLMDQLEQFKSEHPTDETIIDDIAGKAFVEQFGLETFTRADNAIRANKASKQTAETFQAAATFMELLAIWGPIEPDIQQKIKFAKFHALRIVKALKAGEDPNLSNPKQEPEAEQTPPALDPNDPEIQALNGSSTRNRQPSVAEVPDEADTMQANLARQSSMDESIHPSRAPSAPPPSEAKTAQPTSRGVSPLPQDAASFYTGNQAEVSPVSPDRKSSIGGNYFPRMPSPGSGGSQGNVQPTLPSAPDSLDSYLNLPSAPPDEAGGLVRPNLPTTPSEPKLPPPPTTFAQPQPTAPKTPLDSFQAPVTPAQPPVRSIPPTAPPALFQQQNTPQMLQQPPPNMPMQSHLPPPQTNILSAPPAQPPGNVNVEVDEESMMRAQKHARWAISALNFEDVPTAIRELQLALHTLGAR